MRTIERATPEDLKALGSQSFATVGEAIQASGLGWGVEKHPLFVRIPGDGIGGGPGNMKRADNLFGIVRMDNLKTLGAVSGRYEAIDNATALAPMQDLIDTGHFTLQGGKSTHNGAHVYMRAAMEPIHVANHRISCGVFARFWHDGTGGVGYYPDFTRDTCFNSLKALWNGIGQSTKQTWKALGLRFRHTSSSASKLANAEIAVQELIESREQFKREADIMLASPFSRREMEQLVERLVPSPDLRGTEMPSDREVRSWEQRFEAIMQNAWEAPDLADVRNTRWGALNAIADYEQHLVRVTGTPEKRQDRLVEKAMEVGPLVRRAEQILREGL